MASETQIGQLVINLKIRTEALEKGLETAKKKLQEIESENKNVESSNKSLESSWMAVAATAGIALAGIISSIKSAREEYKAHEQAMSSLQNVSDYTGESMSDLSEIMDKYSNVMTKTDLATTIKNFTLMGYSAKDTDKMIESLTNSAIRNRNANYTVSEAVRVASEGYRQGLSTLSDSAGVTENLSVMLDNYAKSIGKTASQLTETEKNQAYLNRTMHAAEPFANAMSDYMDTLAGKQGQYSQAMRETQVAYTETIEPMLVKFEEFKTSIVSGLGEIISSNESATVGITTFSIAILSLGTIFTVGIKGVQMYKTAIDALNISSKALKSTMTGMLIFSAVIAGVVALTNAEKENEEATRRLEEVTKRYNDIKNGTFIYTDKNISQLEKDKEAIEEQIEMLQKKIELEEKIKNIKDDDEYLAYVNGNSDSSLYNDSEVIKYTRELNELNKQYKENIKTNGSFGNSIDELNEKLKENEQGLNQATAIKKISKGLDTSTIKKQQEEAAQLKVNADQMQNYLNIVKNNNKSTTEYQNAVKELSKTYPEAANAEGIIIDQAQNLINTEQLKAAAAWKGSQDTIQSYINMINAALNSEGVQKQVADNIGIAYENIRPKLEGVLGVLQTMANYQPNNVPNVKPTSVKYGTSRAKTSSYQNKALDNYKKQIEHKKAMDQISLKQEISMYQTALRRYAKTSDEKNEIREKIYELNKELANKEKELLQQQTEDYEAYIQQQKNLRGSAYDVTEQTKDYNKIIQMHKSYLSQIMKDERLSLDERKQIYREELQTIRDYEQQKRDLRVEQIDNTVSQLTSAITKQLEELQEKDKAFIDKQIEEVEKLKEIRINAINAEYDAKIEAIEKELQALDKAEQQKSRDEEDAEYEQKKKRLEDLVAFEHDAVTKANYQKELDKLIAEYQKTLDQRVLEDKKEALNNQKDLLQEEQENKVQAIEQETEKQKEVYNKQLNDLEEYYNKQVEMAQETAEKMLLNVSSNQDKILNLLKKYGNAYEITGQSLGEKLAQGINEGLTNKIENIIQKIQDTIDAGIENKLRQISASSYRYEEGSGKPKTSNVNVVQNNYIQQNPEMPSETYRKLNNVSENLAAQLRAEGI